MYGASLKAFFLDQFTYFSYQCLPVDASFCSKELGSVVKHDFRPGALLIMSNKFQPHDSAAAYIAWLAVGGRSCAPRPEQSQTALKRNCQARRGLLS
ncbi:hypothetical protein PGT21_025833 [Puccinia graminis f. sp. tritici]|uniref:Uncharacterized protein n=1 Tax=Puccinia graminis f. sp. tritici TaxID=56615 RepID=A0A5B0PB13_PUCGR|nr:hypothetical protein PGT21_025833 [Puccinia graminis f. sp. tritici]